jgi:hypothetical protein
MRSGIHGTFATLLLMVPLLSIPALAIFGIPQFAPVVASPLDEGLDTDRERRVGQSARSADDGFLDSLDDAPEFGSNLGDPESGSPSGQSGFMPGHVGESVPIKRNGGRGINRDWASPSSERSFADTANPMPRFQGQNQAPSTERQFAQFSSESSPRNSNGEGFNDDRPLTESRDTSLDFRQDALQAIGEAPVPVQQPPSGRGTELAGPRVFQRQRDRLPETNSQIRQISAEDEPLTWQSAVRRLNELEIRNFRLQPAHRENQFMFICSYTPSDSPRVSYRFEAEADEPLKAVEKVLEQIAEWQQRR